jgi:lipopolysaccharide/colanic/teichoic acid biosynthesis glycosyltransferase
MTSIEFDSAIPAYTPAHEPKWVQGMSFAPPTDGAARRTLNFAVAVAGIIATGPLMMLIAIVIKITSRGPALYTQPRVGLDRRMGRDSGNHRRQQDLGGRPFTIYKFRTMRPSSGSGEAQVWASPDDPRVTGIGRILRKYRLDELPQLFNVLRGDMNIVGPRPEQPRIFEKLRTEIERYQHRQCVLPGITGWAQINHHYDVSVEDAKRKVAYDLEYIARCSAIEDFKIMLRTLPVIAFKKGAW